VTRSVLAGARWATSGLPLTRRSRARDGHPEDCTLGGAETRGRPRARDETMRPATVCGRCLRDSGRAILGTKAP